MINAVSVKPLDNYLLSVTFDDGQTKICDIKPVLDKPVFSPLKNVDLFSRAYISFGAVAWRDENGEEIDICPDKLYKTGQRRD